MDFILELKNTVSRVVLGNTFLQYKSSNLRSKAKHLKRGVGFGSKKDVTVYR
jgi:hypothetical protein